MLLIPAICQMLFILYTLCPKNIQELCKPCCDHLTGLWTVVVCDTHLQGTHIVPLEFSLSQKTNLFFTSVINIYDASKSLLFVLWCVLGIILVLGWETALKLHGHNPGKWLQNTTTKRPEDGSSRLHKTNCKALKCKTSWNSFALLVSKNAFSPLVSPQSGAVQQFYKEIIQKQVQVTQHEASLNSTF